MNREPAFPDQLSPDFPLGLKEVICKALEKDRELRYQRASDLRNDLQRLKRDSEKHNAPTSSRPKPFAGDNPRTSAKKARILAWVLLGIFLILSGSLVIYFREILFPPPFRALQKAWSIEERVAILPFQYVGDEASLGYIAQGLSDDLNYRLANFPNMDLFIASRANVYRERIGADQSPEAVGRRLGVNLLVEGKLQEQDRNIKLVLSVYDITLARVVESTEVIGNRADLVGLGNHIYELAAKWLNLVGTEGSFRAGMNPANSNRAYDHYLRAAYMELNQQDAKDLEAAIGSYQDAINIEPSFSLAHMGLARCYLAQFRITKDNKVLQKATISAQLAVQLDDLSPDAHTVLSAVYEDAKNKEGSLDELKRAVKLAPFSDAAYRNLGDAYSQRGNEEEFVRAYQKAVNLNPSYLWNQMALGYAYLQQRKSALKALTEFQRVIAIAPDNPLGFEGVGSVYLMQGKWSEAIPQYQKALALAPDAATYSNLGAAYFFLQRYDEAVKMYEKAVQINANQNEELWGNLGDAYRWLGQAEKARGAYKKTIAIARMGSDAQSSGALGDIGLLYAKMGDQSQAVHYTRLARAKSPLDVQLMYSEGQVYALLGQPRKAITAYSQAVAKGYKREEIWDDPENAKLQSVPEFVKLVGRSTAK